MQCSRQHQGKPMESDRNKHKAPNLWRTNSLQWCRLGTACSGNRSAGKLRDVVIPLSWGLLDHMDSTASILGCPVEGRHHLTEGGQGRAKMVRAGALVLWAEAVRAGFVQPREGMACGNLKVPPQCLWRGGLWTHKSSPHDCCRMDPGSLQGEGWERKSNRLGLKWVAFRVAPRR